MKRKIKTVRLLANFFRDEYYEAYKELILQFKPWLQNPDQLPSQIRRLDFKPDLPRPQLLRINWIKDGEW